jgi:beta-lactamase regulating signal transducer with metallopeptidase domain
VLVSGAPAGDAALPIQLGERPDAMARALDRADVEVFFPWLVSIWLAGVLMLLARAVTGWWRVRDLHQRALRAASSAWQATTHRLANGLGLDRLVRIVELPDIDVPFVVGCLRPVIVLPISAMSQLNVAQVEAILAHELAHIRRHDYLVNLLQTLAETLFFYHPAVW